jgi:hypothetical protein
MRERPEIWLVVRGEQLVAEPVLEHLDAPWFYGRVVAREGFSALQPMFDREQRMATDVVNDPRGWWRAYRRLREQVHLIKPAGRDAAEFLLHIEGRRARWRYSDLRSRKRLDEQLETFERRLWNTNELRHVPWLRGHPNARQPRVER